MIFPLLGISGHRRWTRRSVWLERGGRRQHVPHRVGRGLRSPNDTATFGNCSCESCHWRMAIRTLGGCAGQVLVSLYDSTEDHTRWQAWQSLGSFFWDILFQLNHAGFILFHGCFFFISFSWTFHFETPRWTWRCRKSGHQPSRLDVESRVVSGLGLWYWTHLGKPPLLLLLLGPICQDWKPKMTSQMGIARKLFVTKIPIASCTLWYLWWSLVLRLSS